MTNRLLALAAALALAAPAVAGAQDTAPWSPPRFTAGWVFTPSMGVGVEADDNVTVRGNGSERPSDTILLFRPRGEVDYNGRRSRFSAGYQGAWQQFQNLSELNRYEQHGRVDGRWSASPRVSLTSKATLTMVPSTDLLAIAGIPFARVGSRLFDLTGGATVDVTRRSAFGADYTFQYVHFEPGLVTHELLRGGYSNGAAGFYRYKATPRIRVGARYELRDTIIAQGADEFLFHNWLGTVEYDLGPHSTISGGAGVSALRVVSTGETIFGPALHGEVKQEIERAVLGIRFDRSFVPSYGFGGTTRSESLAASALVPFLQGRLTWYSGVSARRSQPLLTLRPDDVQLQSYWLQTSLGYGLARWLRVEGYFAGTYQNTLLAGGRIERNRVGVQFVTTKPMRIQ